MKRITTHPRVKERKERAYARGATPPGTKPNPQHRKRDKHGKRVKIESNP